jgi:putative CocE/NonD family hydrolase
VAVLTVGGWYDAENLFGALETYRTIEASSPGTSNRLVMGPWSHGGWARSEGTGLGPARFGMKTAEFYREHIELPFFEHHLKGVPLPEEPEAWAFETGRDAWHALDAWPPRAARPAALYLRAGGSLAFEPPDESDPDAADSYVSDPARPVPYIDAIGIDMLPDYPVADQRFAARRPDVLVYQTPPLDADVTLAGPLRAELTVSTSGTDSDWIVKLIDVYPADAPDPDPNPANVHLGGYQRLVRGDVMRGKFRDSLESPAPFRPDEPTAVAFTLQDIFHTFRTGHRIMVQVQSTWFPLIDRNPQTFVDIYGAKPSDFRPATERVYRSRAHASRLGVLVVPAMKK